MFAELAAAAIALAAPYLAEAVKGAMDAVGEAAVKPVLDWMRAKLSGKAKDAFEDFARQPEDKAERDVFQARLAAALEADPALADELKGLLEKAGVVTIATQTQTVSGDNAIGAQAAGADNQINIDTGGR
jgi:hypothetical protein